MSGGKNVLLLEPLGGIDFYEITAVNIFEKEIPFGRL